MDRIDELNKILESVPSDKRTVIKNLINEIEYLENELEEIKKFPMIKVHPRNKDLIKPTPAAKIYKEFLQQYNNSIKNLYSMLNKNEEKQESPLRLYLEGLKKDD